MAYSVARRVIAWYRRLRRDLPWRRTRDPYRIWVAEVMLQQTRVAAVISYYERFLKRFPDVSALAAAEEAELLAAWSGLGYYRRVRNLQKAARMIVERGEFPRDLDSLRALPGVGEYTAAAVASIAFGLPYAVVDGNVRRVLSRFSASDDGIQALAGSLLDRRRPGEFNQALMELGATVCSPRRPACGACPLAGGCEALRRGVIGRFPERQPKKAAVRQAVSLLILRSRGCLLLSRRDGQVKKLAGFWELPEASQLHGASVKQRLGSFRHTIVNHDYHVNVWQAVLHGGRPAGFRWIKQTDLARIPLSTATRKALRLAGFKL